MSTMITIPGKCTVKEAAEIIGCTTGRVRQLRIDGLIEGETFAGRLVILDRKSVEKFAEKPQIMGRPRVSALN